MKKTLAAHAVAVCIGAAILSPATLASERVKPKETERRAIVEAVSKNLKDPYSAKFHDIVGVREEGDTARFCGYVNAKNSLGAYTGKRLFMIIMKGLETDGASMYPGEGFYSEDVVRTLCDLYVFQAN